MSLAIDKAQSDRYTGTDTRGAGCARQNLPQTFPVGILVAFNCILSNNTIGRVNWSHKAETSLVLSVLLCCSNLKVNAATKRIKTLCTIRGVVCCCQRKVGASLTRKYLRCTGISPCNRSRPIRVGKSGCGRCRPVDAMRQKATDAQRVVNVF